MKSEADFIRQQITVLKDRLGLLESEGKKTMRKGLDLSFSASGDKTIDKLKGYNWNYLIEWDAGTSCNIPAKGYGAGYGSFRITMKGDDPESSIIERVKLGKGYSCNAAEIDVLAHALSRLGDTLHPDSASIASVHCIGDSQIALGWLTKKGVPYSKTCPKFPESIARLRAAMTGFKSVTGQWRTRTESVRIFGH